eukprot:SAG31_NODE_9059_length_1341_cov_6.416264_1_plen_87_part_00
MSQGFSVCGFLTLTEPAVALQALWSETRLAGKHNVSANLSLALYGSSGHQLARLGLGPSQHTHILPGMLLCVVRDPSKLLQNKNTY